MAPSRGRGRGKNNAKAVADEQQPQSTRSSRQVSNSTRDVYEDMLAEAAASDLPEPARDRPLKRRKVASQPTASQPTFDHHVTHAPDTRQDLVHRQTWDKSVIDHALEANQRQVIEDSSEEDDDESNFEFEDVDLDQQESSTPITGHNITDLSIPLDPSSSLITSTKRKKRPATSAEKSLRLIVHKLHLLYLLTHCMHVNSWCNDDVVHKNLRNLLSTKNRNYLNPQAQYSQFQRNRSFMEGLQDASNILKLHFNVTTSGMRRPRWLEPEQDIDDLIDDDVSLAGRQELRRAARDMEGSQDVGNQLFCALLRSAGVDARLVCSLQVLPFTSSGMPKEPTPKKPIKRTVFSLPSGKNALAPEQYDNDSAVGSSSRLQNIPSAKRRLGVSSFDLKPEATKPILHSRSTKDRLDYPVFWVEAFNEAHQKWIAIDPTVTNTINKPLAIEPPTSCSNNQLVYAIAFERDGAAKDVTVRYTKAFNAKTRKQRVESTPNGNTWLKRSLKIFQRGRMYDRDSIENIELDQKLGREGLPSNVQDFKDHPVYALERHLKRHEVIHPLRECGKVNAGTAAKPKMERVFRRKDVLACRSAAKWYRVGREIKEGEQPLKYVTSRRSAQQTRNNDEDIDEDGRAAAPLQTGLYAMFQTVIYKPAPVERGRVPRNAFGNLDVYVPSMVPAGGTHIKHPLAKQAAQILRVDATDAVTGFKFKGRQGTAVIEGVVVPTTFAPAVAAVVEGMEYDKELEESRSRSLTAMKVWKRFLTGLRIAERVAAYGNGDESEPTDPSDPPVLKAEDLNSFEKLVLPLSTDEADRPLITAGRYSLMDAEIEKAAARSKKKKAKRKQDESESEAQFTDEEEHEVLPSRSTRQLRGRKRKVVEDEDLGDIHEVDNGGGFLPEDVLDAENSPNTHPPDNQEASLPDDIGGGFLPDDGDDIDAGGFLIEDTIPQHSTHENIDVASDTEASDTGGGFLVPDDEIIHAQQLDTALTSATGDNPQSQVSHDSHGESELEGANDTGNTADCIGVNTLISANEMTATKDRPLDATNTVPHTQSKVETGFGGEEKGPIKQTMAIHHSIHDHKTSSETSDKDSLLSHDPEDEDAEPDWLESD